MLADAFILHDFLEEKVILDGQFFPGFDTIQSITAFAMDGEPILIFILYNGARGCK